MQIKRPTEILNRRMVEEWVSLELTSLSQPDQKRFNWLFNRIKPLQSYICICMYHIYNLTQFHMVVHTCYIKCSCGSQTPDLVVEYL